MAIISFTKLAYRQIRNLLLNMIKRRGVLTGVCGNLFVPATFFHPAQVTLGLDGLVVFHDLDKQLYFVVSPFVKDSTQF